MTKYTFTNDTYWDSRGCDCCEDTEMTCFNSEDTDIRLGSASSVEDCYAQAIITELSCDLVSDDYKDHLYQMSLRSLKDTAKGLGIKVEILD